MMMLVLCQRKRKWRSKTDVLENRSGTQIDRIRISDLYRNKQAVSQPCWSLTGLLLLVVVFRKYANYRFNTALASPK
jgi:hypothetical protein